MGKWERCQTNHKWLFLFWFIITKNKLGNHIQHQSYHCISRNSKLINMQKHLNILWNKGSVWMSIFRIGWRCTIVEKSLNGNRLPFSGNWEYQKDFVLTHTGTTSQFYSSPSFVLLKTNDVKINRIQQKNIALNK